jgi:hypothetical protein
MSPSWPPETVKKYKDKKQKERDCADESTLIDTFNDLRALPIEFEEDAIEKIIKERE